MAIKTSNGMTARERVMAAARGQPIDRVPVMHWLNETVREIQAGLHD